MRVNPLLQVGVFNKHREEVGLQLYFCAVEEGGMHLPFLVKVPPRRHCTHQASRTSLLIVPGWTRCGMKGRERGGGPLVHYWVAGWAGGRSDTQAGACAGALGAQGKGRCSSGVGYLHRRVTERRKGQLPSEYCTTAMTSIDCLSCMQCCKHFAS